MILGNLSGLKNVHTLHGILSQDQITYKHYLKISFINILLGCLYKNLRNVDKQLTLHLILFKCVMSYFVYTTRLSYEVVSQRTTSSKMTFHVIQTRSHYIQSYLIALSDEVV